MDGGDRLGLTGVAKSGGLEALTVLHCVAPSVDDVGHWCVYVSYIRKWM